MERAKSRGRFVRLFVYALHVRSAGRDLKQLPQNVQFGMQEIIHIVSCRSISVLRRKSEICRNWAKIQEEDWSQGMQPLQLYKPDEWTNTAVNATVLTIILHQGTTLRGLGR